MRQETKARHPSQAILAGCMVTARLTIPLLVWRREGRGTEGGSVRRNEASIGSVQWDGWLWQFCSLTSAGIVRGLGLQLRELPLLLRHRLGHRHDGEKRAALFDAAGHRRTGELLGDRDQQTGPRRQGARRLLGRHLPVETRIQGAGFICLHGLGHHPVQDGIDDRRDAGHGPVARSGTHSFFPAARGISVRPGKRIAECKSVSWVSAAWARILRGA